MKAAAFAYLRADDLPDALAWLAEHGADSKLIAGGQSLVPMMAMRLVRPAVLIDIGRIDTLKHRQVMPDLVRIGAGVRQREVETDPRIARALPLLRDALAWVGHVQTRNRGTIGGSLAHADPSAELPLVAAVLDARLTLRAHAGPPRSVSARDFFLGPMSTAIGDTECLYEIDWPRWSGDGVGSAFQETAMRHGDFALAAAACQLQVDADGRCLRAALGLGAVDGRPRAFDDLAKHLIGRPVDAALANEVATLAAARVEPGTDPHADQAYRRHLAAVMLSRAILGAARAGQASDRQPGNGGRP